MKFFRDTRGAFAPLMGILMVPLMGFLALGFEVGNWYQITHAMQNAADSAAIAAATNGGANYDIEAKAVAAAYGFGPASVAVSNTAPCPDGSGSNCYSVTISTLFPLLLSQVVGYQGNGNGQKLLSATSVSAVKNQPATVCLLALGSGGINGTAGNFNGCNTASAGPAQCIGTLGIGISFAAGANNCGAQQVQVQ